MLKPFNALTHLKFRCTIGTISCPDRTKLALLSPRLHCLIYKVQRQSNLYFDIPALWQGFAFSGHCPHARFRVEGHVDREKASEKDINILRPLCQCYFRTLPVKHYAILVLLYTIPCV